MNKLKKINLVFGVAVTVIIGLIGVSISRNSPYGIVAMVTIGLLQTTMLALIITAYFTKNRILAILCRLTVIAWTTFAVFSTMSSSNEDAWVFMSLYFIAEVTAIICGVLRSRLQNEGEITVST